MEGSSHHFCEKCHQFCCHNPACQAPILFKGKPRLLCTKCSIVYYCSQKCQHEDWKSHRKWCGNGSDVSNCPFLFVCPNHKHKPKFDDSAVIDIKKSIAENISSTKFPYYFSCGCQKKKVNIQQEMFKDTTKFKLAFVKSEGDEDEHDFFCAYCMDCPKKCKKSDNVFIVARCVSFSNISDDEDAYVVVLSGTTSHCINLTLINNARFLKHIPTDYEIGIYVRETPNGRCFFVIIVNGNQEDRKFWNPDTETWEQDFKEKWLK